MQCDVKVYNVEGYNASEDATAIFYQFRSWKLSQLLFASLEKMSSQSQEDFERYQRQMRKEIKQLIALVNNKKGWTIIGWHRRGITGIGTYN